MVYKEVVNAGLCSFEQRLFLKSKNEQSFNTCKQQFTRILEFQLFAASVILRIKATVQIFFSMVQEYSLQLYLST